MTLEEFAGAARLLFDEVAPMTLATCAEEVPWASDVYFAASGYDLVFLSSPDSRHCRNLALNRACAVTIHASVATWHDIRGLQMEGVAAPVETMGEKARAIAVYFGKFPFARDLLESPVSALRTAFKASVHVFRPTRVRYLDNRLGMGTRFSLELDDGRPAGPPRREKPGEGAGL